MDFDKEKSKVKPPKTYKEQVDLFKSRNLFVEDSEYAEKTLQRINYYRLSAYGLTLKNPMDKNQFISSSSFNKMLSLYEFDRRLRLLLLGVLETIEIAFRTHISYEIAHKFGPLGYKNKRILLMKSSIRIFWMNLRHWFKIVVRENCLLNTISKNMRE